MDINKLLSHAGGYLPEENLAFLEKACKLAQEAQIPDLERSLETALILANLQMDHESLAAAVLLNLPPTSELSEKQISKELSEDIKKLIDGVNKVNSIPWMAPDKTHVASLRKMFLAMVKDVRVIIISLANRLQMMKNIKTLPVEERQDMATETMEVYAPLAHRLGIGELKQGLEDLAFRQLHPVEYKQIVNLLNVKNTEWERYITHAMRILKDELEKAGIEVEINGRPKSVYSIHRKIQTYAKQGKEFTDIHDLLALRVLVNKVSDCYNSLGVIHHMWHPLPGQFDDYIANPKGNQYQSLHTTVIALEGKHLEIQIKTHQMHHTNEYGIAAHWRYKEGSKGDMRFEEKFSWFRQIMGWQKDMSSSSLLESLKTDIFRDQVYVFTPAGEIRELPQGSTPLDFAYRIHTDLGHRCAGGKVNGRLVSLTYQLKSGDVVEVVTTKSDRGPSLDWLNPDSGYVGSNQAREKIRLWFRKRERGENLDRGKGLFDKALKRLGTSKTSEEVASLFGFTDSNEFLIALGCGDISANQIGPKLVPKEEVTEELPIATTPRHKRTTTTGVQVLGVGDLLTHLAPCCNPIPGDEIVGFVTRTKGVTIHRKDCSNISSTEDKERLVDVNWGARQAAYPVPIIITAENRMGLLKDITTIVSEAKVNIVSVSNVNHDDGTSSLLLTVDIPDIGYLSKLFSRIERIKGVIGASRVAEEHTKKSGKPKKSGK